MLNSRLIGGILLIVGTSIGGGMLALPVSMAAVGMMNSIYFLLFCWLVMTAGALLILEVNMHLPPGSNMVSMAKSTLGLPGQVMAWVTCLFLLYTLLSAYISGGTDVLSSILQQWHLDFPTWLTSILFTIIFSIVIYHGVHIVDYVNRGLMFGKLGVYLLLVFCISPHVQLQKLGSGSMTAITGSLMILITSFGFSAIVPSLRDYFENDVFLLRKAILYGSLLPLICYITWMVVIMGVVDRDGQNGLLSLMNSDHATTGLTASLSHTLQSPWIQGFFSFFTSICILTALLGVSLGLFDFLADGFKLQKKGMQGLSALALTFIPPLGIVLIRPGIYLHALSYAGVCCVLFLLLLPIMMAWQGRKTQAASTYMAMVPGGRVGLTFMGCVAFILLGIAIFCK